jgi:hypothetical protein
MLALMKAGPAVMLSASSSATCPTCERRVALFDAGDDSIGKIETFPADKIIVLHCPMHGGFGVRAGNFNEPYEPPRT